MASRSTAARPCGGCRSRCGPSRCPAGRAAAQGQEHPRAPTTTPTGPAATRPAWPACSSCRGWCARPCRRWPPRRSTASTACTTSRDRRSSPPTTTATSTRRCCCRRIPEPWRHQMFVGAAADYFFGNKVTAPLSALVLGAIPIERHKVSRVRRPRGRADRRRLEHADLPRGRPQPRRLGPAVPGRRRLPVAALRRAGRAGPRRGHRSHPAQGPQHPGAVTDHVTFGAPLRPADGEDSRRFGARIEAAVAALADEAATDWYSARKRAHAGVARRCRAPTSSAPGAAPGPSATAAPSAAAPARTAGPTSPSRPARGAARQTFS